MATSGCFEGSKPGELALGRQAALRKIDRLLLDCRRNSTPVVFDLSDVALMDRDAVRFFAGQIRRGVELVNCPGYLEHWISREIFP